MNFLKEKFDFCLLIPVYNNINGLIRSLKSVHYTPGAFYTLIIDDGSQEPVHLDQLQQQGLNTDFLVLVRLPQNRGITVALQQGLDIIRQRQDCHYVARLDCGDFCAPERFFRQVDFLQKDPELGLVGSWCYFKNPVSGSQYAYTTPTFDRKIRKGMHFRNLFIHPAAMWRLSAVKQNYPDAFPAAEDYGFFYELMLRWKVAIIPEFLVTCELNGEGISTRLRSVQFQSRKKVVKQYGTSRVLASINSTKLTLLSLIPTSMTTKLKQLLFSHRDQGVAARTGPAQLSNPLPCE